MVRKRNTESERLRVPPPMIKRRIPSGRGAMEQPNVTHDGETRLTPQFWLAVALTGIATGLFGDLLMWILAEVERAGFHYHSGYFQNAVAAVSSSRRIIVLLIGGVIGAVSWYLIRRYLMRERSDIDDAIWNGDGELSLRRKMCIRDRCSAVRHLARPGSTTGTDPRSRGTRAGDRLGVRGDQVATARPHAGGDLAARHTVEVRREPEHQVDHPRRERGAARCGPGDQERDGRRPDDASLEVPAQR